MARKPITQLRGGIGPRQRIWNVIRLALTPGEWTVENIIQATRLEQPRCGTVDLSTLRTYMKCLQAAGIVELARIDTAGARARKCYRLVRDEGVDAPRVRRDGSRVTQGLAQEQMWRTLRLLGSDTNARELAAHASSTTVPVAERAAADYLQTLAVAGYLDCSQRGHGTGRGGVQARYRLRADMNTGPKPPMVCRTRVVFDANLGEVVWAPTVTEEDADHGR